MRATILLTALSASLAFVTGGAQAREDDRDMSSVEQAGYDTGWDAANDFCRDLRAPPKGAFRAHFSITTEFKRGCKKGFDEHIDNNRSCRQRMEEQDRYSEMWDARRDACS